VVVGLVALALVGLPAAQPKLGPPFFKGEQEFSPTGLAAGRLNVLSLSGEETVLDLKKKPAVLVATWCGGCDEVLEAVASLAPSKQPYVVGVYLDRTRLGEEKEKLEEKVRQIVPESEIFLLLDPPPVRGVPGFLFVQDNGRIVAGDTTESVKGLLGLWATELSSQIPLAEERSIPRAAAEKTG
jgi:thiol-disulfide isomerase/thioredoxin